MLHAESTRLFIKPVDRLSPFPEIYTPQSIEQNWSKQLAEKTGLHFILDLDENLFDTVTYWIKLTNRVLGLKFGVAQSSLPDRAEVLQAGGPSNYYHKKFPQIFPSFEAYEEFADECRHRYWANQAGPSMVDQMDSVFDSLKSTGNLLGGLTARPANKATVLGTKIQLKQVLQNHAVPEILFKPVDIPLARASQQKLKIMERLSYISSSSTLVLIDDSISTAKLLSEHNQQNPERPIVQILNGAGPLTTPKLLEDPQLIDTMSGIFLMRDWSQLEQTIKEVSAWRKLHPSS